MELSFGGITSLQLCHFLKITVSGIRLNLLFKLRATHRVCRIPPPTQDLLTQHHATSRFRIQQQPPQGEDWKDLLLYLYIRQDENISQTSQNCLPHPLKGQVTDCGKPYFLFLLHQLLIWSEKKNKNKNSQLKDLMMTLSKNPKNIKAVCPII